MARQSIVPKLKEILEPYLDIKMAEWEAMPDAQRLPTIPFTPDLKVNVRQLVRELKDRHEWVKESHEQHFFNYEELAGLVNFFAKQQGLKLIGSRALVDAEDDAALHKIQIQGRQNKRIGATLARALVQLARKTEECNQLKARLNFIQNNGTRFRDGDIKKGD